MSGKKQKDLLSFWAAKGQPSPAKNLPGQRRCVEETVNLIGSDIVKGSTVQRTQTI